MNLFEPKYQMSSKSWDKIVYKIESIERQTEVEVKCWKALNSTLAVLFFLVFFYYRPIHKMSLPISDLSLGEVRMEQAKVIKVKKTRKVQFYKVVKLESTSN